MGSKKFSQRKRKNVSKETEHKEVVVAPHSFVIHRGLSCSYILELTRDFRKILEPFTALKLKEKKKNKIKDFVSLCGIFHVSHISIFNKASKQLSFKVLKVPRGPTLTFKVHQFNLSRDILSTSKRQYINEEMFHQSPLVAINNFTGEGKHLKLMALTFQNMFPHINPAKINSNIRRCVLFSYNQVDNLVDVRHYSIRVSPVGLTRAVNNIVTGNTPDLSKFEDISDFILQNGTSQESQHVVDKSFEFVVPQKIKGKYSLEKNKSCVHLHEIGPRLTLELTKIEDGVLNGEVLYHNDY